MSSLPTKSHKIVHETARHQDERINQYLHTIAHELRTPFVSIQGFTSLLVEKYKDILPAEGQNYLERISTNLSRVENLLTDITKLAKISISEKDFNWTSTSQILNQALDSYLMQLHEQKVKLNIQENLPDLFCDADAMVLVFSNLIGNAIKYSRDFKGGEIEIGYVDGELFHKFYIRDNGIGFKAEDNNKVFRLFSRLRNKTNVDGSGLGLSIVKQIIEAHGGEVWVISRRYKGSTFYFTLPKHTS